MYPPHKEMMEVCYTKGNSGCRRLMITAMSLEKSTLLKYTFNISKRDDKQISLFVWYRSIASICSLVKFCQLLKLCSLKSEVEGQIRMPNGRELRGSAAAVPPPPPPPTYTHEVWKSLTFTFIWLDQKGNHLNADWLQYTHQMTLPTSLSEEPDCNINRDFPKHYISRPTKF
jgi:hypothetical protein